MALAFEESTALLGQFKAAQPAILTRSEVHGIQVTYSNDKAVLTVLTYEETGKKRLRAALPSTFTYQFEGRDTSIAVEVTTAAIARAQTGVVCQPGDPASGDPSAYYGTLGWNLYLNDVLVFLSCWHVLCALGNDTPVCWNITIQDSLEAKLYTYQNVYSSGNVWDYALGKYIQPVDAAGTMRLCENGEQLPHPGMLSPPNSVHVGDGQLYYKVGARPPICRTGALIGIGDFDVKYDDGAVRSFNSQLIFTKMSDPGDSGSVAVRRVDTSVTGLIFAGSDQYTLANPIFLVGWQRTGSIRFNGGVDIPMFRGNVTPNIGPGMIKHAQASPPMSYTAATLEGRSTQLSADIPSDIPSFSAGKLFLGEALQYVWGRPSGSPLGPGAPGPGAVVRWNPPAPLPIRPDISVDTIWYRREGVSNNFSDPRGPPSYIDHFLCFG